MPNIRISWQSLLSHDVFLGIAILYAAAQILIVWGQFRQYLISDCQQPIQVWLLVGCLSLVLFRVAHIFGGSQEDVNYEPWCFNLFTPQYKLLTFLLVAILYPFLLIWVLLGTLWYAQVQHQDPKCFKDAQQSWYFVLWLVIFYLWIIGYNTAITISIIIYCRNRTFHNQYVLLLDQYGDEARPEASFHIQGLSPATIYSYPVYEIQGQNQEPDFCTICRDELCEGDKVRVLSCDHKFHIYCIDGWLMRKSFCPNCKRSMRRSNEGGEQPLLQL